MNDTISQAEQADPLIEPGFDAFVAYAKEHRVVPVWRSLLADQVTPVAIFARCIGEQDGFLLESVENGERWSRWSFLGRNPLATIVSNLVYFGSLAPQPTRSAVVVECSTRSRPFSMNFRPPIFRGYRPCTRG